MSSVDAVHRVTEMAEKMTEGDAALNYLEVKGLYEDFIRWCNEDAEEEITEMEQGGD